MVLIDMEMPKNCYECMLVGEGGDCLLSYMTNTDICCNFSKNASRPNDCPIKNIENTVKD